MRSFNVESALCGLSMMAQSAGDRVKAFRAEKPIAMAMVIPN